MANGQAGILGLIVKVVASTEQGLRHALIQNQTLE